MCHAERGTGVAKRFGAERVGRSPQMWTRWGVSVFWSFVFAVWCGYCITALRHYLIAALLHYFLCFVGLGDTSTLVGVDKWLVWVDFSRFLRGCYP